MKKKHHSVAIREPNDQEQTNLEAIESSFQDGAFTFLLSNGVLDDPSDNNPSDISSRYNLFASSSEDSPRLFDEDGRLFEDSHSNEESESIPDLESMSYDIDINKLTIIQTDNTAARAATNATITPNKDDNSKPSEEEEEEEEE